MMSQLLDNNKMNIISSNNQKSVVSLQELVPQHDCLKLLILHTPYTLVIDTLHLCVNLIKLDLSKNNLQVFPYLGDLANLKFIFIHQNKLDVLQLRNIFQKNDQRSVLSENIVWVTFWGNKNSFLGRHYLVNQTKAIAVDKNMVVYEQRCSELPLFQSQQSFGINTDISLLLKKKNIVNRHASQEEYMNELWIELRQLRKKQEVLFPIIKIQKWWRGWALRNRLKRNNSHLKQSYASKAIFFKQWKNLAKKLIKLRQRLRKKGKQYLLISGKQGRLKQIEFKMIEWAKDAKRRVSKRNHILSNELKFYNIIRQNYLNLKSLYDALLVKSSSAIYISRSNWQIFERNIVPFVKLFNSQKIIPKENICYSLHYLYSSYQHNSKQFIKMLNTNFKSVVFQFRKEKDISKIKRGKNSLINELNLKSIYRPMYCGKQKMKQIAAKLKQLNQRKYYSLEQLIKIQGSYRLLTDITRGVYFYNTKRLNGMDQSDERIQLFSEAMLKRLSSAVKIQKVWRGCSFRKKNQNYLKLVIKMQRAATIIQRWYRRLPSFQKKKFMIEISKSLSQIQDKMFYIQTKDYLTLLKDGGNKILNEQNIKFLQQNCRVYINRQSNLLSLCWDCQLQKVQVIENIELGKIIFSKLFFIKEIGLTEDQINTKIKYDRKKHSLSDIGNLFHYQTKTSIVKKNRKKYLQVICQTKAEAKLRFFMLKLLTYSFKNNNGVNLFSSSYVGIIHNSNKVQIGKKQSVFISNQNASLVQMCQFKLRKQPNISIQVLNNKFYLQNGDKKPFKAQEKFYIFIRRQGDQTKENKEEAKEIQFFQERRYKTQISGNQQIYRHLQAQQMGSQINQTNYQISRMKSLVQKRSMKKFKIDRRLKHRKQNPSFILDSVSINDRLTTQPDAPVTQITNAQNSINLSKQDKPQSLEIQFQKNQQKIKPRLTYVEKRSQSFKRKQDQSFIKRFVNIGNFIQNQFANDYRRRLKTQTQNAAAESADKVKRSVQRSLSHRVQQIQQKYKIIRQKHSQHRQIVSKNEVNLKQHSQKLKQQINQQRQKKINQKTKLKRLKVSFAQECYPLAMRSKKSEYFS